MPFDAEAIRLTIILISVIASNWMSVHVIKTQILAMDRRVSANERNITKLFNDTRFIMTGNEIRKILHEQIDPLSAKVDSLHDDMIAFKARAESQRTRLSDG